MRFRIKKLAVSLLAATAVNAAAVLLCEFVIKTGAAAEVAVSTVIGLGWLIFVFAACREDTGRSES